MATGTVSQLVYARVDIARFTSIYTVKGRQAFVATLSSTPVVCGPAPQSPISSTMSAWQGSFQPKPFSSHQLASGQSLEQVEQVVRRAAEALLDQGLEGECCVKSK